MEAKFTFHPVGQGLFYSGSIGSFRFIYDCGSFNRNSLRNEISKLCNDLSDKCNKPEIDLLIISHFHYDHICGIEDLLRKFKINNVIIPYMTDEQKLFTIAKLIYDFNIANIERIEDQRTTEDLSALLRLVINPDNYFREMGVRNISILGDIDNTRQSQLFSIESELLNGAGNLNWRKRNVNDAYYNSLASEIWRFEFYYKKIDDEKLSNFKNDVEKLFGTSSAEVLSNFTRDRQTQIRDLYKKHISRDLNHISLVCCHGPSENVFSSSIYNVPFLNNMQLLTGDLPVKSAIEDLSRELKDFLPRVFLSLIPHHGSETEWDERIFKELHNCQAWICSYGEGNRFKHPSGKVRDSFKKNGKPFTDCTQNECINIPTIKIYHSKSSIAKTLNNLRNFPEPKNFIYNQVFYFDGEIALMYGSYKKKRIAHLVCVGLLLTVL